MPLHGEPAAAQLHVRVEETGETRSILLQPMGGMMLMMRIMVMMMMMVRTDSLFCALEIRSNPKSLNYSPANKNMI